MGVSVFMAAMAAASTGNLDAGSLAAVARLARDARKSGPTLQERPLHAKHDSWNLPFTPVPQHGSPGSRSELRVKHAEFGTGMRRLTLDYVRERRGTKGDGTALLPFRSLSRWQGQASYLLETRSGQAFSFSLRTGADQRKPLIAVDDGHWQRSHITEGDLGWLPDPRLQLDAGWRSVAGHTLAGLADRRAVLASGALLAEHGLHLSATLDQAQGAARKWRLGLDAGSYSLTQQDVVALGARTAHDQRVSLSFRLAFR